ncbi:MAG: sterol desaturase family protein [Myxococcota bacterium]
MTALLAGLARRALMPVGLGLAALAVVLPGRTGVAPATVLGIGSLLALVALTGLELAVGRWRPQLRHLPRDTSMFALGIGLDGLAKVAVAAVALWVRGDAPGPLSGLPWWLGVPLGLVVADGVAWTVHWAFHAHPLLWRLHALHHLPDALYTLMSTVNAPLMVLVVRALPLATLTVAGFHPTVLFAYAALDAWTGLASHTGVDTHNPWLSSVWVTPEVHRLHHRATAQAVNHALLLTVWDRVFGTYEAPTSEVPRVGLPDSAPGPRTWLGALFLRSTAAEAGDRELSGRR